MAKRSLHVISHTHWDREWYLTFQEFRLRLVDLLDGLLDLLEQDPEFKCFHLDGQTIVLGDYLEVRPSQKERLQRLIRERRILIGPWYLQNDEFLTSAEATIRNLLYGIRTARDWAGDEMKIGYLPDQFGNISQMPQILRGVGIDNCIFGRGYNPAAHANGGEFWWKGPDGSRVLAVHLSNWYNNAQRLPVDPEQNLRLIEMIAERCSRYAQTGHLLLMNGVDHLEAQEDLSAALELVRPLLPEDTELLHSTLPAYIECVKGANPDLPEFEGELREGDDYHILHGTLAARVYLKQLSFVNQDLLERVLEPLAVWACASGLAEYPREHMAFLWKKVMENHPHDSICGCSRDAVHEAMVTRFREAKEIIEEMIGRYSRLLIRQTDSEGWDERDQTICIFNTSTVPLTHTVEAVLDLMEGEPTHFSLTAPDGSPVPYRIVEQRRMGKQMLSPINLPGTIAVQRFRIRFSAADIPPMGLAAYRVGVGREPLFLSEQPAGNPRDLPILENEYVRAEILPDGSLNLTDKETGRTYGPLHVFEDAADAGHAYVYHKLQGDVPETTAKAEARLERIEENEAESAWRIEIPWQLPRGIDGKTRERSRERVPYRIVTEVRLSKGERVLRFRTVINNQAGDHRLRVRFGVPFQQGACRAGGQLDVIERDRENRWNRDSNTHPNWRFVDLTDEQGGLCIVNRGLHEYEWLPDGEGVALTLLRAVRTFSKPNEELPNEFEPNLGNQCIGEQEFEYGVFVHAGNTAIAKLCLAGETFGVPLRAAALPIKETRWRSGRPWVQEPGIPGMYSRMDPNKDKPKLDRAFSFLRVSNPSLMVSALKMAEDRRSVVVRIWNPEEREASGELWSRWFVSEAHFLNLLEERICPAQLPVDNRISVTLQPKQIATLELVLK